MLISVQNILGGQLSAIGGQHLEIELPLSKSESNRALMIMHYAGIEELRNSGIKGGGNSMVPELVEGSNSSLRQAQRPNSLGVSESLSNSDDTVLLQKHLNTLNKYLQGSLSGDCCPLTLELDCHNAGTVFRFLMTAVAVAETQSRRDTKFKVDSQTRHLSTSASQHLSILLTGSDRMKNRPIDSLVEALRSLGVVIE